MKKVTIWVSVFVILAFSVLAEDIVFKQFENINLKRSCYYNNTWCDASTLCNMTVMDQNNSIIASNKPMTFNPSYFNYNVGVINDTGTYTSFMTCLSHGEAGFDDFSFQVTRTGATLNSYNVTLYIIGVVGLIIFAVLLMVFSSKIKFESEKLWIANLTTIIRWFMTNLSVICLYVMLAMIRFILDTQSKGQELGIKYFDYFMIVVMFFMAGFMIATFVMMINSFVENSMKKKAFEKARRDDD